MYFDNAPGGEHPPLRSPEHLHAAYRRLFTIVKTVSVAHDIAEPVLEMLQGLFGADGAVFAHLYDRGARFVSALGTLSHMRNAELDLTQPMVVDFFKAKKPRVFRREQLSVEALKLSLYSRFESAIIVPLWISTYPVGIFALSADRSDYFSQADADTLYEFGVYFGMLLEERERGINAQILEAYEQIGLMSRKISPDLGKASFDLIQNFAHLRKCYLSQQYERMAPDFDTCVNSIERISKCVQNLKAIGDIATSRPNQIEVVELRTLLDQIVDYNRTKIEEVAEIELKFAENLPKVRIEYSYLWQALQEIIDNAVHALGRAESKLSRRLIVESYALPNRAVIVVRDNGCGISLCDMPHLFEPFFTQWPPARGLGLIRARLNMMRMHGQLYARLLKDGGMMFKIVLPDADHVPQEEIF